MRKDRLADAERLCVCDSLSGDRLTMRRRDVRHPLCKLGILHGRLTLEILAFELLFLPLHVLAFAMKARKVSKHRPRLLGSLRIGLLQML